MRIRPSVLVLACIAACAVVAPALIAQDAPKPTKPASEPGGAAAPNQVPMLAWMTGAWRAEVDGALTEEQWSSPEGGVMLGYSRVVKSGKVRTLEWMKLTMKEGALTYTVRPGTGDRVADFVAQEATASKLVLVNEKNDMPRTITYEATPAGGLRITLAGTIKGEPAKEEFELQRAR